MFESLSLDLHGKNSINVAIGLGVMFLSSHALKSLNITRKIQLKIMSAISNGNFCTTIVSCYSPTHASDETNITTFFNELSFLVQSIPKHMVLIISRDVNV